MIIGWVTLIMGCAIYSFALFDGGRAAREDNLSLVIWSIWTMLLSMVLIGAGIARIIN